MSENIEHRAFWNLPTLGIIERHYGIEGHLLDAFNYLMQHSIYSNFTYKNNYPEGTFGIDTGKINRGETEIPKGTYKISYGGMLAGKTFARRMQEQFGNRESPDDFYKRIAFMTGETFEEVKKRYENKTTEGDQA